MAQVAEKDAYSQLTDKQQAVVDEYVDDPTAQNTELAERAGVSRSTVYNVKESYGDILESQLNQQGRDPGEETVEGDPFNGQLEADDGPQMISERPRQPGADPSNNGEADSAGNGDAEQNAQETDAHAEVADGQLQITLDEVAVRDVVEYDSYEAVRCAIIRAVMDRAFADG